METLRALFDILARNIFAKAKRITIITKENTSHFREYLPYERAHAYTTTHIFDKYGFRWLFLCCFHFQHGLRFSDLDGNSHAQSFKHCPLHSISASFQFLSFLMTTEIEFTVLHTSSILSKCRTVLLIPRIANHELL